MRYYLHSLNRVEWQADETDNWNGISESRIVGDGRVCLHGPYNGVDQRLADKYRPVNTCLCVGVFLITDAMFINRCVVDIPITFTYKQCHNKLIDCVHCTNVLFSLERAASCVVTISAIVLRNLPYDLNNYWNGAMSKHSRFPPLWYTYYRMHIFRIYVCKTRPL